MCNLSITQVIHKYKLKFNLSLTLAMLMYNSSVTRVLHMYNFNLTYVMFVHKWSFI